MIKGLLILWVAGFVWFIYWSENVQSHGYSQAAVVFTGRGVRLKESLRLLREKKIEKLFVSGVNPKISFKTLQNYYKFKSDDPIALGYQANNTAENAVETAQWLSRHNILSFLLITDSEHMIRSLLELKKHTLAKIIPHTIRNTHRRYKVLWMEYHKCLWIQIKQMLGLNA